MLLSMQVQDFGLIDQVEVEFSSGLNVITGETGSGKSLLLEALLLTLGAKASADVVRTGREKARVTAVFALPSNPLCRQWLAEQGLLDEGEEELVLVREVNRQGRSICRVNGQPVPVHALRQLGQFLVSAHLQHGQQQLLQPQYQLEMVDRLGGEDLLAVKQRVGILFRRWQQLDAECHELAAGERERVRRRDLLLYQIEEIAKAGLREGEEEELTHQHNLLLNAEKLSRLASETYALLYGGSGKHPAATDLISRALRCLQEMDGIDPRWQEWIAALETALYQLEDAAREVAAYRDGIEFNPQRLRVVEERLEVIEKLKRKYGASIAEILGYRKSLEEELDLLTAREEQLPLLQQEVEKLAAELEPLLEELSRRRLTAARYLEEAVKNELEEMAMPGVRFAVMREELPEPTASGRDRLEFMVSFNPGEPLRPLARVASGGELSRFMLAAMIVLAGVDDVPTLLFDEVDAGIGGQALLAVAAKVAELARRRQLLVVTHAPQLAALAGTHFTINKETVNGTTTVLVRRVEGRERVRELARMLGGDESGRQVLEHARYLLRSAGQSNSLGRGTAPVQE